MINKHYILFDEHTRIRIESRRSQIVENANTTNDEYYNSYITKLYKS